MVPRWHAAVASRHTARLHSATQAQAHVAMGITLAMLDGQAHFGGVLHHGLAQFAPAGPAAQDQHAGKVGQEAKRGEKAKGTIRCATRRRLSWWSVMDNLGLISTRSVSSSPPPLVQT